MAAVPPVTNDSPMSELLDAITLWGTCVPGYSYASEHWRHMTVGEAFADAEQIENHAELDPRWSAYTLRQMVEYLPDHEQAWREALFPYMETLTASQVERTFNNIRHVLTQEEIDAYERLIAVRRFQHDEDQV